MVNSRFERDYLLKVYDENGEFLDYMKGNTLRSVLEGFIHYLSKRAFSPLDRTKEVTFKITRNVYCYGKFGKTLVVAEDISEVV